MDPNRTREILQRAAARGAALADRTTEAALLGSDIVTWGERRFYLPDRLDARANRLTASTGPIVFQPHQKTLLRYMFDMSRTPEDFFSTIVWSTNKKSGKTLIAGLIARWVAETTGKYADVVCIANDQEQARGRIYEAAKRSIELAPTFDRSRGELIGPLGVRSQVTGELVEWEVIQRGLFYLPTASQVRAIAKDYKGEAGANQSAALFTEVWAMSEERARRLSEEMTPPPTRPYGFRFFEGYAGFEGEGDLWQELWELFRDIHDPDKLAPGSRRVTRQELEEGNYGEWPFDDLALPLYVNEAASAVAYIDQGPAARRMPWQTTAYYQKEEAGADRHESYLRLQHNEWVSSTTELVPQAWWDACYLPSRHQADPRIPDRLTALDKHTPVVLGVDAATTGDCTALVAVTRAPWAPRSEILVRSVQVWAPPPGRGAGGALRGLDYETTIKAAIKKFVRDGYNIVCVAYDPYQCHHMMQELMRGSDELGEDGEAWDLGVWCEPIVQTGARNKADYGLYSLIKDRKIAHLAFPDLDDHMRNAAAKMAKDEDTKMRIIKRGKGKIDAAVALSMACYQCLFLTLD